MFQSLFALPIAALIEAGIFLVLYFLTPMGSRATALLVAFLSLTTLYGYSFIRWPGIDVLAMYTAVLLVTAYLLAIIASVREKRRSQGIKSGAWFHWAPMALVVFFLVLFAADSLFVFVSKDGLPQPIAHWLLPDANKETKIRSAFPGTVHRDFQKKEALYNAYLDQVKRQKILGWQIKKGWLGRPAVDHEAVFQVAVTDRQGEPVVGATISGLYQRPADSRLDQTFQMRETDIGVYQVSLVMPEPGQWDLTLFIQRGDQRHELHAKTSVDDVQE